MTVAVVGGAGYVGSVLVPSLLESGASVRVIDGCIFGRSLPEAIDLRVIDLREVTPSVFEGCSSVVNLGGLSNDPMADFAPEANRELNTEAAVHIAKVARAAGVSRYVFASSCSIYDGSLDVELDESSPVRPMSYYASSKFDAERRLLEMAYHGSDFEPVIFRKGTIHGWSPRMRFDLVVNTFVKEAMAGRDLRIHGTGEMWRPLLDVEDAAEAYRLAIEAPSDAVRAQVFNVVGENRKIGDLAYAVRDELSELGVETGVTHAEAPRAVRNYRASAAKLENALGWRARRPLTTSIREMVGWIREQGPIDLDDPRYYNIEWIKAHGADILGIELPATEPG